MLPKHARRVETERETRAPAIGGRIASHEEGLRRDGGPPRADPKYH